MDNNKVNQICEELKQLSGEEIEIVSKAVCGLLEINNPSPQINEVPSLQEKPFDFIRRCDPSDLLNILKNELPQTIAVVLSNIEAKKAAILLQNLPIELQNDVAIKIACMNSIRPEIIKKVENILYKRLHVLENTNYFCGGMENLAEILFFIDPESNKQIMESLKDDDPELAEALKGTMQMHYCNIKQPDSPKDLVLTVYGHDNFVEKIAVNLFDKTSSVTGLNKDVYLNTLNNWNPSGNSWVTAIEIKENLVYFVDKLIPLNFEIAINRLDDRGIQKVLREVDSLELAMALKSANKNIQEKIFRNISKRAEEMLKEDMEYMGPIKKIDSNECQEKIVSIVRHLIDAGQVFLINPGELVV